MPVIWCLKFCNMTKSGGGHNPPAPNSGGLVLLPPVIYAHGDGMSATAVSRSEM